MPKWIVGSIFICYELGHSEKKEYSLNIQASAILK